MLPWRAATDYMRAPSFHQEESTVKNLLNAGLSLLVIASFARAGDIGPVDQKAPKKETLVAPETDKGIETVGLMETFKGKVAKSEKRHLYFIVHPLSNPEIKDTWWVQQEVSRDGESFSGELQFGEENAGVGEYFAVLAIAIDKTWAVGDTFTELPADAAYSKVKIVKRK
jgi:hypothetical protein